jgi:hypothetical protein
LFQRTIEVADKIIIPPNICVVLRISPKYENPTNTAKNGSIKGIIGAFCSLTLLTPYMKSVNGIAVGINPSPIAQKIGKSVKFSIEYGKSNSDPKKTLKKVT